MVGTSSSDSSLAQIMAQQHNKVQKRQRRSRYLKRRKLAARAQEARPEPESASGTKPGT